MVLITDHIGSVKQQYAYNSWGERVDTLNWQGVLPASTFLPVSQQFTTRSYTGQEAMDAVGLINYGGRIYDPKLARFIQADPIVQDGEDLQAYNRYAYVRNNPLTLTDPSGFSWWSKAWHGVKKAFSNVWKAVRPYVGMVVSAVIIGMTGCFACAAAFNSAWTVANGGSFKDGLIAGVSTYAMSFMPGAGSFAQMGLDQIAKQAVISGIGGGVMSVLQGGKFGHGFMSAGIGYLAGGWGVKNPAGQFALAVGVGGTVSELTGGKFANGAMSAAAGYAANYAAGKVQGWVDSWGSDSVMVTGSGSDRGLAGAASGEGWAQEGDYVRWDGPDVTTDSVTADMVMANGVRQSGKYEYGYTGEVALDCTSSCAPILNTSETKRLGADGGALTLRASDQFIVHSHPSGSGLRNEIFGPGDHQSLLSGRVNFMRSPKGVWNALEAHDGYIWQKTLSGPNAGQSVKWNRQPDLP